MPNGSESDTDESMGTNPMPHRNKPATQVSMGTNPIPTRDKHEPGADASMGTNPMPSRNEPDAKVSMGTKPIPIRDESNVEICYLCKQTRCRRGINPIPKYCEASMGTNPMQNLRRAVREQTPRHSTKICSTPDWHHLLHFI